jgi:pimeloyl-ACP methyl ester carboxylesterase
MTTTSQSLTRDLRLPLGALVLPASLVVPAAARGLVVFAHGSGSNRHSCRNRAVAQALQRAGLATLLFDLLTATEQRGVDPDVDLAQLGGRLLDVIGLIDHHANLAALPLGLFGSSTGAAVALAAAAQQPSRVRAVVCRGGRPDLVPTCLAAVSCPTLLLVGSLDVDVLELNAWAAARLRTLHELRVVQGAGHLFAEPGALEQVGRWSCEWFLRHLRR